MIRHGAAVASDRRASPSPTAFAALDEPSSGSMRRDVAPTKRRRGRQRREGRGSRRSDGPRWDGGEPGRIHRRGGATEQLAGWTHASLRLARGAIEAREAPGANARSRGGRRAALVGITGSPCAARGLRPPRRRPCSHDPSHHSPVPSISRSAPCRPMRLGVVLRARGLGRGGRAPRTGKGGDDIRAASSRKARNPSATRKPTTCPPRATSRSRAGRITAVR